MEYEMLKTAAGKITMPNGKKRRMAEKIRIQLEREENASMKAKPIARNSMAVFAAAVICVMLSVAALAASETVKGYFRDITNLWGAVVGTSYEQATDEITVSAKVEGDRLVVTASFADPGEAPYVYSERLGIGAYEIVDVSGNILKEGTVKAEAVVNGQTKLDVPLDGIGIGSHKLVIKAFVSEKKADQPLFMYGNWEIKFEK